MSLSQDIVRHVRAGFPCLLVTSIEHDDAEREIRTAGRAESNPWTVASWNPDAGFALGDNPADAMPDPVDAIHAFGAIAAGNATIGAPTLLIARNLHLYFRSPEVIQAIDSAIATAKRDGGCLVILAPSADLPPELERQVITLAHGMPTKDELEAIARSLATEHGEMPQGHDLAALRDASAGLTRLEAEGAYSLSLAANGRILPADVWKFKAAIVGKSGLLTIHRGEESFQTIGGMDALKTFTRRVLRPERPATTQARGVLLLGVSGTGKSAFAKALGNETGRPTLTLDFGRLMGSLVGQTEERMRQALAIVDAMAPAILFCDEIEKALAGSNGEGDSGVSARMLGSFLTWLNDHESDVFFVATANKINKLPPEFTRAERFDAVYFLDFPTQEERAQIWELHTARHHIDPTEPRPVDENWTGAEIASCCRLAALLAVPLVEAAANVVPIHATAAESVGELRQWAHGRCLAADRPGMYQSRQPATARAKGESESESKTVRRNVQRPQRDSDN